MYIASNDIKKKIHAPSELKNLRFSNYFDDVTRVWSNLKGKKAIDPPRYKKEKTNL